MGEGMRTQKEIEKDSLQKLIRDAFQLAMYMNNEPCALLLKEAFDETDA